MLKDEDFPSLSSNSFYVCLQIRILKLSESVCVLVFFFSLMFQSIKKMSHFSTSSLGSSSVVIHCRSQGDALFSGTLAADLRFSHLQTDVW